MGNHFEDALNSLSLKTRVEVNDIDFLNSSFPKICLTITSVRHKETSRISQ